MAIVKEFVDCTSLSISYDIMGIATVSYVIVSNEPGLKSKNPIQAGNRTFTGYVSSISMNQIVNTNWYESHVTLIATTED